MSLANPLCKIVEVRGEKKKKINTREKRSRSRKVNHDYQGGRVISVEENGP